MIQLLIKRKERGKEKKKKSPNFTLSGSPGACGFSLLTLKRKEEGKKKKRKEKRKEGKKEEEEKKKKE